MSAVFNYHRTALSVAVAFVLFTYVLAVVIEFMGNMEFLNVLTPFRYFFAPNVVENGINPIYLLLCLIIVGASGFFTYKLYGRRDIHY